MIPKGKIGTAGKVAEGVVQKMDGTTNQQKEVWLKGFEQGVMTILLLDEIEDADQVDISKIKTLKEFNIEADRTERKRQFEWVEVD